MRERIVNAEVPIVILTMEEDTAIRNAFREGIVAGSDGDFRPKEFDEGDVRRLDLHPVWIEMADALKGVMVLADSEDKTYTREETLDALGEVAFGFRGDRPEDNGYVVVADWDAATRMKEKNRSYIRHCEWCWLVRDSEAYSGNVGDALRRATMKLPLHMCLSDYPRVGCGCVSDDPADDSAEWRGIDLRRSYDGNLVELLEGFLEANDDDKDATLLGEVIAEIRERLRERDDLKNARYTEKAKESVDEDSDGNMVVCLHCERMTGRGGIVSSAGSARGLTDYIRAARDYAV